MDKQDQGQEVLLPEVFTEKEVLNLFGVNRGTLDRLRLEEKLPFCKISRMKRLYLVSDVLQYLKSRRVILNKDQ